MELIIHCSTSEDACNQAIQYLERFGAAFDYRTEVVVGRLGAFSGAETGVEAKTQPWWRLRLDYDPIKGLHYNAQFGKSTGNKAAFCFPSTPQLVARIVARRSPPRPYRYR